MRRLLRLFRDYRELEERCAQFHSERDYWKAETERSRTEVAGARQEAKTSRDALVNALKRIADTESRRYTGRYIFRKADGEVPVQDGESKPSSYSQTGRVRARLAVQEAEGRFQQSIADKFRKASHAD